MQTIIFVVQDGKLDNTRLSFNIQGFDGATPVSLSLPQLSYIASGLYFFLDPLLDGGYYEAYTVQSLDFEQLSTNHDPHEASDIQEKAKLTFKSEKNGSENWFPFTLRLPTFKESLMIPGEKLVDTANSNVAAFITWMLNGSWSGAGSIMQRPTDYRGWDLTELKSAVEDWGKSTRRS